MGRYAICKKCKALYDIDITALSNDIKQLKRKLKRDCIISVVNGKDLVGIYFADTNGSKVLLECSPEKADKIIKIWNKKDK